MDVLPFVASLGVHLTWGCHPVFSRYLQEVCGLGAMPLLLACQFSSLVFLAISACLRCAFRCACGGATAPVGDGAKGTGTWGAARKVAFGLLYGIVTASRASTNLLSSRYTAAWHVTLVAMLGPFVTGLLSRACLGERVAPALWPCVVFASCGVALVATSGGAAAWSRDDRLGCGLQFVSIFFSGAARVLMKASAGEVDAKALLVLQYFVICIFSGAYVAPEFDDHLATFRSLPLPCVTIFFALAFFVTFAAAEAQVICIRWLGPANYTTVQPSRVLSTLGVGALLLGERVEGTQRVAGLCVVVLSLAAYVLLKARKHRFGAPGTTPGVVVEATPPDKEAYNPVAQENIAGVFAIGDDDDDDDPHPGDLDVADLDL